MWPSWTEAYLRTKWQLDPSSRLATIDIGFTNGRPKMASDRVVTLRLQSTPDRLTDRNSLIFWKKTENNIEL